MVLCTNVHRRKPHLYGQSAHQHAVSGDLTHVASAEFEHLCCDGVLLHQRLLKANGDTVQVIFFFLHTTQFSLLTKHY